MMKELPVDDVHDDPMLLPQLIQSALSNTHNSYDPMIRHLSIPAQ
jgi:hypothetical protein